MTQVLRWFSRGGSTRETPNSPEAVKRFVQRNLRWNMAAGIVDAVFIALSFQIISNETVIPLLVTRLSGSTVILGLVGAIHSLGHFIPQLFMAGRIEERPYKKPITVLFGATERLPFFFIGLAVWAWGGTAPMVALVAFVVLRSVSSVTVGMIVPAWFTLIGKVIPTHRRGFFLGFGRGLGALLGAGGALVAGHLLETQPYPRNFALCFLLASAAMLVSWGGLAATREPPDLEVKPRASLRDYFGTLPSLLRREDNYRSFVVARGVSVLGTMAMSFLIVYGAERFVLSGRHVGLLTATIAVSQGFFHLAWGLIGDRSGHKAILCVGSLCMAGAVLTALITPALSGLYVVFALVGAAVAAEMISSSNIVLEFAPPQERPTYIGLTNTLIAPCRTLAPVIGGTLAAAIGFPGLFVVAAGISTLGAATMALRVQDPRTVHGVAAQESSSSQEV